jgi:hypothetical protein
MGKPMVVRCNWCLGILEQPGALVFTPPDEAGLCIKIHVCVACYARVIHPGPAVAAHEVYPEPPKHTEVDHECGSGQSMR